MWRPDATGALQFRCHRRTDPFRKLTKLRKTLTKLHLLVGGSDDPQPASIALRAYCYISSVRSIYAVPFRKRLRASFPETSLRLD